MKEDTGQILIVDKIVNNNIVIAKDFRGREVVAIGKGVGFRNVRMKRFTDLRS